MTRKLTSEEIKLWQKALREGIRHEALGGREEKLMPHTSNLMPKLDLHGFTIERAHKKFIEFVYLASMEGSRKLLVITGKGNPGKIREELPKWCEVDYLSPLISSCKPAELRHGGAGAFYITLRSMHAV